ncbi:MAG: hypothetical protein QMB98_09310 [Flaviflexus sp.]|uniref:hypothetical protein n=1 Tax=Flaviflexus sp. TaxID=1969482 RepID=UPI00352FD0FA
MTNREGLSKPAFALAVAIGIAIFVLAMVVFGTRLDSGPEEPPAASADEVARQDAAIAYEHVAEVAGSQGNEELATMASEHLEAVGGIWLPWPDGAPEGATNPPIPAVSSADLTDLLATSIEATRVALEEGDPADAALYASILIRQQVAYEALVAQATGTDPAAGEDQSTEGDSASEDVASNEDVADPEGEAETTEEQAADGDADTAAPNEGLTVEPLTSKQVADLASSSTLVELDRARQWLETAAPHLDSPERITTRIALLNDYTSEILDSGMADTREPFAALPEWFLADPSPETATRLESEAYNLVALELFTYIPTSTMAVNPQVVATILEFLTEGQRAEIEDFPYLTVTPPVSDSDSTESGSPEPTTPSSGAPESEPNDGSSGG